MLSLYCVFYNRIMGRRVLVTFHFHVTRHTRKSNALVGLCARFHGEQSLKGKGWDGLKRLLVTFASFCPCLDAGLAPSWCKSAFLEPCRASQAPGSPAALLRSPGCARDVALRKLCQANTAACSPSHPGAEAGRKPWCACIVHLEKSSCFLWFIYPESEMF